MSPARAKWSRGVSKCKNCLSTRRKHRARGYCIKCYPIISRIELVSRWDAATPGNLKDFPKALTPSKPETIDRLKGGIIKQLNRRLEWLRYHEERLNGYVSGNDLEYGLGRLARKCGVKSVNFFRGEGEFFQSQFNDRQRRYLFELIDRIEQKLPWKIDWHDVFFED